MTDELYFQSGDEQFGFHASKTRSVLKKKQTTYYLGPLLPVEHRPLTTLLHRTRGRVGFESLSMLL